jgi:hypothetical protein
MPPPINPMNRITGPAPSQSHLSLPDPLPATIDSLASARWMREPDWRTFQEKLMSVPRLPFLRSRPAMLTLIGVLLLCGGATAAVKIYETFYVVEGVALLDDGTTVQFKGTAVVDGQAATIQPAEVKEVAGQPLPTAPEKK